MNKYTLTLLFIVALIAGYFAFTAGLIILKAFIGLFLLTIFVFGFWLGRITKRCKCDKTDITNTQKQ